jgi:hypothetical protein
MEVTMNESTPIAAAQARGDPQQLRRSRHPLEIIPFFSRIPPSTPRNLMYTAIWNTAFAAFFTVLALVMHPEARFAQLFWATFVIANCIGFLIHGGFMIGGTVLTGWMCRQSSRMVALYYSGVSLVGVFAG